MTGGGSNFLVLTITSLLVWSYHHWYDLCLSYHSNTEQSWLQSFFRPGHYNGWTALPQDGIRHLS